jgi:hypothetical protein
MALVFRFRAIEIGAFNSHKLSHSSNNPSGQVGVMLKCLGKADEFSFPALRLHESSIYVFEPVKVIRSQLLCGESRRCAT